MSETPARSSYVRGLLDSAPFILVVAPFAMLFGVVATGAGLDLIAAMSMSVIVIAGAAQFTALQLLADNSGALAALAASLAVNLRSAMYSASLVPYIGRAPLWQRALISYALFDQNYALALQKYETDATMTVAQRVAYYAGVTTPVISCWYAFTLVGILAGNQIPEGLPLDFAVPITFLALVAPMVKTWAHAAAAGTSVVLALALHGMPSGTGILVGGVVAMAAGAAVETWREGRK
ncbi:AzlC family ABC transporter permease [Anianabacter salinae]|uniref:AzlC family ABC transporter permease n=1 Tax=Anianabacter salinae TaxID=2851023 RepID=UPI00225E40B3|nr:AzlC family ABC transporter permease [Anianabacter salinae]MBV0913253.1 AzlC family ABC transporter permease [Anianabacter salinae]